jgi:hypothetical protein
MTLLPSLPRHDFLEFASRLVASKILRSAINSPTQHRLSTDSATRAWNHEAAPSMKTPAMRAFEIRRESRALFTTNSP